MGQVCRQVHLPRDRRWTDLSDRTTPAGEDRAAVRCGEPVGVWQQLVVRPQREHADGVDHRKIPRCAGTRGERAADHRGVGGVVPVQPASDPRADRDGQGRRELRGAGHCQRAEQGRPRAVLRQPGGLHRAVPPADLRAAAGARDRDVPRPRQRDQHRAWQAAVPEQAGDDPPRQPRPGLQDHRGAGGDELRLHVRRQRRDAHVCADAEHGDVVGCDGALGPGPGDPAAGGRRGVALRSTAKRSRRRSSNRWGRSWTVRRSSRSGRRARRASRPR